MGNSKDTHKALKYFKHAIKLDPKSIQANYGLGKILHQTSENVDAPIHYYKFVIEHDPQHYKALCQLGIVYLEKSDLEKAAEYLKQCLTI